MACGISLATSSKARSWNNTKTLPHWGGKLLVRSKIWSWLQERYRGLWILPISKQILVMAPKGCILPADQFSSQIFCHVKFALTWLTIVVLFWGVPFSGEVLFLFPPHLLLTCFSFSICFLVLLFCHGGGLVSPWSTAGFPPDFRAVPCRNSLPSIRGRSSLYFSRSLYFCSSG